MQQSGRTGIGRRIARTLEDSREKRKKIEDRRGTRQNEQIRKSLKLADSQGKLKNLEGGEGALKTVKEMRRRQMNEWNSTITSWKVA
jgi:hypothetical protein